MSSDKCRLTALRYVAARMRTEGQIIEHLERKGFVSGEISETMEMLRDCGYVNDQEYCVTYYRQACIRGRGRRRIERELENKRIPRQIVSDAIDKFLAEEYPQHDGITEEILPEKERALKVARKMANDHISDGGAADRKFMAKMGRKLYALGYGNETIYGVISCVMRELTTEEDI